MTSNWTGNLGNNPPALGGDSLVFGAASTAERHVGYQLHRAQHYHSHLLRWNASACTLGGNQFTSNTSIVNSGSNSEDFTASINLGNVVIFTSNATGGNLVFDGVISNTVAHSLTINGGGTVTLNGNNTYGSGVTTTLNGATTLVLGNDNALGASTLLFSSTGGAGTLTASATRNIANNITLNNTGPTGIIAGSNAITFSGNVGTNAAAANGSLMVNNTALTTFTGNWVMTSGAQAAYSATINGTGNVTINGDHFQRRWHRRRQPHPKTAPACSLSAAPIPTPAPPHWAAAR